MKLKLIRHLWGVDLPWEQAFPKIKAERFVGIEWALPTEADEARFLNLLQQHEFEYIAMGFTDGDGVNRHLRSFKDQVSRAKKLKATKITVHSGCDHWSTSQADEFYGQALEIEREIGLVVGHETHRGRIFYNPWITRDLLLKFDGLKLVCDFSHWVCIAERVGWDDAQSSILKLCADRCIHLHARVGYAEGPQVPDPSAAEYQAEVEAHEKWWDVIWDSQQKRGMAASTVTPEFGPPGYLHTLPHTNVPVADLWMVCKYMADRLVARAAKRAL